MQSFQVRWDNDLIALRARGAPQDWDYTNGVAFRWAYAAVAAEPRYSFEFGQRIYTPREDDPDPVTGERPYAGWLYVQGSRATSGPRHLTEFSLELGIVGPQALGEPVQNGVHRLTHSRRQEGWAHQLALEPAATLSARRTWSEEAQGLAVLPYVDGGIGTLWTGIGSGVSVKRGDPAKKRGLYVEVTAGATLVGHDLFLDGNTFSEGVRVERLPLVAQGEVALGIRIRSSAVEYRFTAQTREYRSQVSPHRYGSILLRFYPRQFVPQSSAAAAH